MRNAEKLRNTGRTTALMLRAIAHALENPNRWTPFIDHSGMEHEHYAERLEYLTKKLGLKMTVRHERGREISIRSDVGE